MSYNITITRTNIPDFDAQAWTDLDDWSVQEDLATEQAQDFLELIEKLKVTFPCICDLPDDQLEEGVWSDGPLSNNAGKDLTILGVTWPHAEKAIPVIIKIVNDNGFIVMDPQTGLIWRP